MTSSRRFWTVASASLLAAAVLFATVSRAAEPLLLQWGTIDTSSAAAQAESAALQAKVARKAAAAHKASATAESRAAYIVQFPGPVADEWRAWLESATQVRGYLPEFAYLVWATPSEMDAIAANTNVFWTGEWKKDYKTVRAGSAASASSSKSAAPARWMHIGSFLVDDDGAIDLRARLEALPADVRSAFPRMDGSSAVACLTDVQIDEVAAWPDVEWIEPQPEPRLFNNKAALTNMMNVAPAWQAISAGGLGLTGAGQIVAVADTGLDTGDLSDLHPDFAGRVTAYAWTNGAYKPSASWMDIGGHGTHVCGSALGSGAASSGQYKGMAYEASLVIQGCWTNLSGLPDYTPALFTQAYTNGARIHSDSWGFGTNYAGVYTTNFVENGTTYVFYPPMYVDGYLWTNQDFLAVFAAGNEGIDADKDGVVDPGSVSAPGTAKNCLCVGAAENFRSSGGYAANTYGGKWGSDYPADPVKSDKISSTNVPQGIVAFSGRGPTQDGRFKPDIVAPGSDVVSARSRATSKTGWGVVSANTNYLYMGGTSMATPLTAGALALVRQWLVEQKGVAEPSAALLKALLINGARDMTPGQYGTNTYQEITARPDRSQGFGHVNLYDSLEPGDGHFLRFATNKLSTGNFFTTQIDVGQPNAGTYVLTLAWQDAPGAPGAAKALVNDLDLTVTSPSGATVYYPNNLTTNDRLNNVEFLEFTASETGTYTVRVDGYSVSWTSPNGGQPFALVMRGPETIAVDAAPAFSLAATNATLHLGQTFSFDFASLLTAGYPAPRYNMSTAVSSYSFNPLTGAFSFTPSTAGDYTFTGSAFNDLGSASCVLTVTAIPPPPAVPDGLVLSDVGATSFAASWAAVPYADSYSLDVAALSGSASPSVVLSEDFTGFSSTSYSSTIATQTVNGLAWSYINAIFNPSAKAASPGSAGSVQLRKSDGYLYLPPVDDPSALSLNALGSASGSMVLEQLVSGSWTTLASMSISATCAAYSHTFTNAGPAAALRLHSPDRALTLHDIAVSAPTVSYASLPGYPKSVAATNAAVSGLSPSTDYAARVCASNSTAVSDWSDWVPATTSAADSAPAWTAIPAQAYLFGSNEGYFDFDVSPYASGSPAPAFFLDDTPWEAVLEETGEFTFDPETLGTFDFPVIASNTLGTASATLSVAVTAAPPAFVDLPATVTACANEEVTFTVTATGNPAPVLDIGDTGDLLAYFYPETGLFEFISDDTGAFAFTFTASNIAAVATQTVTVTITDTPVTVPELGVTDITDTSALASWTPCDNVTAYTLQLASDDQFSTGGSGGTATLFENPATSTTAPNDWTYSINSSSSGYLILAANNYVVSEAIDASSAIDLTLSLSMRTYGGSGAGTTNLLVAFSSDNGASWTDLGTLSIPSKNWATRTLDATASAGISSLRFRFASTSPSNSVGVGISNIVLTATQSSGTGSLLLSTNVAGLSHEFTSLAPSTTYFARVKGTSDWSPVVAFSTTASPAPPSDFEQWLAEHGASGQTAMNVAANGHTYWENYLADIDPASTNFLEVSFTPAADGTLSISPFSSNRTYQLLYWTNILSGPTTNPLTPTNLSLPTDATGFGRIRVTLPAPSTP